MNKFLSLATCALFSVPAANAQNCSASSYGPSCGPIAKASIEPNGNTHRITLALSNATPRNHVLMMIGVDRLNLPIAGTPGCFLLVNPVFFQVHMTDSKGEYDFSKAIPSFSPGPPARAQFVDLLLNHPGGPTVRTSNGVELGCN